MDRSLYPCSNKIYNQLSDKLKNSDIDINKIKQLSHYKGKGDDTLSLYKYPEVTQKMVLKSLSLTPQIVLEVTQNCNLSCTYCCYGKYYNIRKSITKTKVNIVECLETLIDQRNKNEIKADLHISFYGGEPLLRFDLISDCVKLVRKKLPDVNITFGMTTNGLLLSKHLDYLIENDFTLLISIDGNRGNNIYRIKKDGTESFEQVRDNIDTIYKKYPSFFKSNVFFSTVLHNKNNYIDVMDFISRWKKTPIFSFIATSNAKDINNTFFREMTTLHTYSEAELEYIRKEYPDAYRSFIPEYSCNITSLQMVDNNQVADLRKTIEGEKMYYPGNSCFLFASRVFVTNSGILYTCEKVPDKYKFGMIKDKKIIIYTKRINKYYKSIINIFHNNCPACYQRRTCHKCFFAENEDVINKRCICDGVKALNDISKKL